jgi:hypothetical protein
VVELRLAREDVTKIIGKEETSTGALRVILSADGPMQRFALRCSCDCAARTSLHDLIRGPMIVPLGFKIPHRTVSLGGLDRAISLKILNGDQIRIGVQELRGLIVVTPSQEFSL